MRQEIVAVCQFHDYILIFTRTGDIFKMTVDDMTGNLSWSKLGWFE